LKKNEPAGQGHNKLERFAVGYNLALKFTIMLACPVLAGLGGGIWLDRQLQTTPWLMLILMVIGFIFSIYAVYRVATRG